MTHTTQNEQNGLLSLVRLVSRHRWFVIFITLLTTGVFYGLNVTFNEFEYRADAQVMVVQYSDTASVDGEKTQRSTENISRNLTKVVLTTSFMDKALQNATLPMGIIQGTTENEKKKSWSETIATSTLPNSSIIQVSVYDTNPQAASGLAQVVADTLIANAADYHGANKAAIELKQIDKVLVSEKPVRPNIPLVTFAGFMAGLFGSILYLFLVKEWKLMAMMSEHWKQARQEQVAPTINQTQFVPQAMPAPQVSATQETPQQVLADPEKKQPVMQAVVQAITEEVQQEVQVMTTAAEYAVFDIANWGSVIAQNVLPKMSQPQVITLSEPIAS